MTCFLISSLNTIKNSFEYLDPSFLEGVDSMVQNKYKNFLYCIKILQKCLNNLNLLRSNLRLNKLLHSEHPQRTTVYREPCQAVVGVLPNLRTLKRAGATQGLQEEKKVLLLEG